MEDSTRLTIHNKPELEALIIHFLANEGVINDGIHRFDCSFRGEYNLSDLYRNLDERTKELFSPTLVQMLQEYRQLPARHPQLTVNLHGELLVEMDLMATYHGIDLTPALSCIYEYVEKRLIDTEVLHRHLINLIGTIGKGLPLEKWKQLYDAQSDQYKAQMHLAIAYAHSDLAEALLPDLKTRIDQDTFLQNVFYSLLHKYNPPHRAEQEVEIREALLKMAPRADWVNSAFGKGFTAKGIETYFGR